MTVVLYPGSFDPIHNGHLEIVETAARLFDEVIVAAMRNPQKGEPLFSLDERQGLIEESLGHLDNVRITMFSNLVVDLARDMEADFIVKGLRAVSDFESELQMAQMNHAISGVDTLFIPSASSHSFLASKLIREIARFGGDVASMVPAPVAASLADRYRTMTAAEQRGDPYRMPEVDHLLDRVAELIEQARPMPLSTSVVINKDETLELLDEARVRLPEELRAARWLLKEREEFLARVQREGDDILDEARGQAERMVQRTEVVKAAEQRARQLVDDAEAQARQIRHQVEDFCDQKLAGFQSALDKIGQAVDSGREKLQATLPVDTQNEDLSDVEGFSPELDEGSGFFDQDDA